ncbi:ECF-type sigma factor [Aeoliella sp. ICT_H6.2]|uniref:ECF-type sigma factor n=1 Tax=Aeoliella straminimaris TaxID=2954799 RepID=A0A9X2JG67_9BACT|nr:ECF-type sigma factor [Aeoliella straminimaris]MCO6044052.1 ECF-type sigma factor [Aeoliella straminimaris]
MADVTQILSQIEQGNQSAAEQLLPLVYDELRNLAAAKMAQEKPGQTLQATALVHDAYIRLVDGNQDQHWESRGHFFAAAAEAMRRILVDAARKKQAIKHGGDRKREPISSILQEGVGPNTSLLDIDEAVAKLEDTHPLAASVVKLRYFCGMTISQTAECLGVSHATVERHWTYARARLHAELFSNE